MYDREASGSLNEAYTEEYIVKGDSFLEVGEASTKLKSSLKMLGLPSNVTRRASVVVYEAEMNVMIHAGGGVIRAYIYPDYLIIEAADQGPGIPDVDLAMQEGYSTASDRIRELGFGAGMGLPNIKRNSDDLTIDTELGRGTTLRATLRFERG
nr:ATP-binding protein [uncultured Dethiosulfovibrio sp.]